MQQDNPENSPIRILHFSDFHLNGDKIEDAQHVLNNMLKSLQQINTERQIDLVIFTGDMLEQGGEGYNHDLGKGFADFQSKVINPILSVLNLSQERFIFTLGNHDVNRKSDKKSLEEYCSNHSNDYSEIVSLLKDDELKDLKKCDEFKSFEEDYYSKCSNIDYKYGKFTSTFGLEINGYGIGISSLNTVWHCGIVPGTPFMGVCQIKENTQHIDNKDIKIAISHFPCYKLEKEYSQVVDSLANNYDMFFSGHTHSGVSQFISLNRRDYFLDVNSGGTLAANTYENDAKYKNAFQIVDYFPRRKYQIRSLFQIDSQEFEMDRNGHYAPDGVLEHTIPHGEYELNRIYEETLKLQEQQRKYIFKSKIHPFVPIKDFIERPNNMVMEGEFIPFTKYTQIKEKLLNGRETSIRIMALSGMGKTRIVAEAFRDNNEHVFYSGTANCESGLMYLLNDCQFPILIIDNCRIEQLAKIRKIASEFRKDIRIISIYNIPTTTEKGVELGLFELGYEDTEPVVETMIERDALINSNEVIKNTIKQYSGNIPLMAKLLIEAYRKTSTLNIENPDSVLQHFIQGSETENKYKIEVLRAISLFEPLGCDGDLEDEFDFLINSDTIHRIPDDVDVVRKYFHNTIEDFERRELLEHAGGCIRIRPIPLAEWLTSQWIQQNGSYFPEIFQQIQGCPQTLNNRLADALKRRFEGMVNNPQAVDLFNLLNNTTNGSFHDERIAFSDTGSRLFLSMGTVSPVMVAQNIFSLLKNREKDTEWVNKNITEDVRRNIVNALERVALLSVETFPYVASSLLILSSAENESFSNNSSGVFVQLFNILLAGTNAPLSVRAEILEENYVKPKYTSIIIRAIDAAFKSRNFTWFDTSGISQSATKINNDYNPTFKEVHNYWNRCADILIAISKQKSDYDISIKKIVKEHVSDFYHLNDLNTLTKLLTYYGEKCNYDWAELRKTLRFNIKYWSKNQREKVEDSEKWYNLFSPKSFLLRVKDAIDNQYLEERKDFEQLYKATYELMEPFAKEFVEEKIYLTDELPIILKDWEFQSHWMIQKIVSNKDISIETHKEILDAIFNCVIREKTDFQSPFITQYCIELCRGKNGRYIDLVQSFQSKLYDNSFYRLSASIEGIIDDDSHSLLPGVISKYKQGKYDNYCIDNYIRRCGWQNGWKGILSITEEMLNEEIDEEVFFPYFTNGVLLNNVKSISDDNILSQIERIVLSYSFEGKTFNTAHQVVELMSDILEIHNRPDFALQVHNKIVSVLSSNKITIHNPFDKIYEILLPKYQNSILEHLLEDIAAEDHRVKYYWEIHYSLGSGFGYGVGPLFKCDYEFLKQACIKYQKTLPERMADMCPVIEPDKRPQDTFFWWLCDNFGDREDVLRGFSGNMGTYSYSGPALASFADYIASREDILSPYLQHPKKTVQEWAQRQINSLRKEVQYERDNEEYSKMIRGK